MIPLGSVSFVGRAWRVQRLKRKSEGGDEQASGSGLMQSGEGAIEGSGMVCRGSNGRHEFGNHSRLE